MRKVYELWLDESGKFLEEKELQLKNMKPSLVGGILIEKEIAEQISYNRLLDADRNHAMDLTNEDKETYVLPILETLKKEYHARQVFFENAEYAEEKTGRQLYLRVIAEGLLQLMQTLNAQSESVELDVLIAQRQDIKAPAANRRILSEEYQAELNRLIGIKKKYHRMYLHEDSHLEFQVKVANKEQKLQLADFACNTRLTRDSYAFQNVRERVSLLHEDAYIFSLTEVSSENYIKRSLVEGYISDAIIELYTSKDELDHKEQLSYIVQRMKNTDYRLLKVQMKQCVADVIAYAVGEDDYEIGEAFLKRICDELVPILQKEKLPYLQLQFASLIQLSTMYLREGDVLSAAEVLKKCRQVQEKKENSLEEIFGYYQLVEKEALLAVEEFDFEKGAGIMQKACESFQTIMRAVETDAHLQQRFGAIKSGHFGDALCMQIYTMLFMQRRNPQLYPILCERSDLALKQYPNEEGALKRHRQYRSHIELEQGNFEDAIKWLFLAKDYDKEEITVQTLAEFLGRICDTESTVSSQYYLMYYLLIMCEAQIRKNPLAELLFKALQEQERILLLTGLKKKIQKTDTQIVDFSAVQEDGTDILYHPMEMIFWKYATYLSFDGRREEALNYYERAIEICFANENYLTMYIIGLGIEAERIHCLLQMNKGKEAEDAKKTLNKKLFQLSHQKLPSGTKRFLRELEEVLMAEKDFEEKKDKYWKASRMITF